MRRLQLLELDAAQRLELFGLHSMYVNPSANEKQFYQKYVELKKINISNIPDKDLPVLTVDQKNRYLSVLNEHSTRFPVVSGNKLIDGLHRIAAAKAAGYKTMDVADVKELVNTELSGYSLEVAVVLQQYTMQNIK